MTAPRTIGFIGLGTMGEPICGNLVRKSGASVITFDVTPAPLERLRALGASIAASVREVVAASDVVFLCLPSGAHVRDVFERPDGILAGVRAGGQQTSARRPSAWRASSAAGSTRSARHSLMRRSRARARPRRMERSASWSGPTPRSSPVSSRCSPAAPAR
jgi:hypothetical protein